MLIGEGIHNSVLQVGAGNVRETDSNGDLPFLVHTETGTDASANFTETEESGALGAGECTRSQLLGAVAADALQERSCGATVGVLAVHVSIHIGFSSWRFASLAETFE